MEGEPVGPDLVAVLTENFRDCGRRDNRAVRARGNQQGGDPILGSLGQLSQHRSSDTARSTVTDVVHDPVKVTIKVTETGYWPCICRSELTTGG